MKLDQIEPLAHSLLDQLSSACVRIEIKGSIARRKPDPHDIELVAIPSTGHYTIKDMFDEVREEYTVNHLEDAILTLLDLGAWEFDPVTKRNGPHYKRLRHITSGVCCDLFITGRRRWGVLATVRTGPNSQSDQFVTELMSLALRRGWFFKDWLLHGHQPEFDGRRETKPCPSGERCGFIIETPEERDVFDALGLLWIEPWQRTVSALQERIKHV